MAIIAVLAGFVLGSIANMGTVLLGSHLIPPPDGVDVTDPDSIVQSIHLFEPRHFVFPFLAHATGTLIGAALATKLTVIRSLRPPLIVAGLFLCGGIANLFMLPHPAWFTTLDIAGAYLPMGWLGWKIVNRQSQ